MFYKYMNDEWMTGLLIYFPDGTILSPENRIEKDGWRWYDEQPY